MSAQVHPFEKAGLGIAPFRFVAVERRVGPITIAVEGGVTAQVGAPGQPMGTCEFCGMGIADCCVILSADGRRFVVGSDCVAKVDADLSKETAKAVRGSRATRAREKKAESRRAAAQARREARAREVAEKSAAWVAANPDLASWIQSDAREAEPFRAMLENFGDLTERQATWAANVRRESTRGPAPAWEAGRQTVRARVVSRKGVETAFGWTSKVLLETEDGRRAFGTEPRALYDFALEVVGHVGEFVLTIEPKADDPSFAFFSRPVYRPTAEEKRRVELEQAEDEAIREDAARDREARTTAYQSTLEGRTL